MRSSDVPVPARPSHRVGRALGSALALTLSMSLAGADNKPTPSAEAKTDAKRLLEEGAALHSKGDDAGALAKFQAAYTEFPSPKLLFDIAQMLADLGNNADAADAFQQFLAAAAADPKLAQSAYAATARERLSQVRPTVGELVLTVSPADAHVETDTRARVAGTLFLSPGAHQLVVSRKGYVPNSQIVAISAGQRHTLSVSLAAEARPAAGEKGKGQLETAADDPHCRKIEEACQAAGFAKGKVGKGLYRDCIFPLVAGKPVEGTGITPADVKACLAAIPSFGDVKGKRRPAR
jgi:hypothetical protein